MRTQLGIDCNFKSKVCVICSNEYKPTSGKQKACNNCAVVYWRFKHAEQAKARGRKRKLMAVEYLGDRCQKCNQSWPLAVYEFHHKDPAEKDYDPAQALQMSWEKFKVELDKCTLLCANCHRMEHHPY